MAKKHPICSETQIWEENGKIMKEEIIREANSEVDLTPHPTRARVLMVDGEVITIDSIQAEKNGYTNFKLAAEIIKEAIHKNIKYNND